MAEDKQMVEKTTKKAEAAEQNAFHLYSVEKQGNKKNRAAAYLVDWIFLWLYLAGSTGWLVSIVSDSGQSGSISQAYREPFPC